jgi:hypothetical protein
MMCLIDWMTFSVTKDIFITRISQQTASRVVTMVTTGWDSSRIVVTITVHSKCINDHTLRSDIFLPKCPTNVRQIWESTLPKSDYLVGHFGRAWEWILKDFFLHFSRWICQTFCDRCVFVSVLSFRCVECAGT